MKYSLGVIFCLLFISAKASIKDPETFVYKEVDGQKLELDVYLPSGSKSSVKVPMIIFIHGGGWTSGNKKSFAMQAEHFASRGFVAASISYRLIKKGSKSYESEFRNCIYDAKSAIRWLKSRASELGSDSSQIILSGGSAGAYLAVMAELDNNINDPLDDVSISTTSRAMILFNPAFPKRSEVPQALPLVHPMMPPVISFFGDQDSVWLPMGQKFQKCLDENQIRTEFWMAKGVGHAFFNKGDWAQSTLQKADDFIHKLGFLKTPFKVADNSVSLIRQ